MAEKNILDILTKVDRPHFTIDGKSYELRHPNELSMTEFHLLSSKGASLISFGEQYEKDPDTAFKAIQTCMDELLDIVTPDLPKGVRAILNPFHVQQILDSFIGLSRIKATPGERRNQKKSSRDSSDSTAEAPAAG